MSAMPTHIRHGRSSCPVARSLDVLGDKWTLLIIREAPRRHNAFQRLLALNGALFYKGNLAELLLAANIVEREEPIQQKLGTAVAIRAMCDTVLVRIEGVQACASSDSLEQWPLHYRRGLTDGLFFDESGNARTAMGS